MTTRYLNPTSAKHLIILIDELESVTKIRMSLPHFVRFNKFVDLGFNGSTRTYNGIPIYICVGDLATAVVVECD